MASKKDLVEAQAFSRRRLLTAFVSGAPGGRELEPGKPLRAVVVGLALTGLLVVGSLVAGLLRPGLPQGWDHNSLVVTKDDGARYVALDGTLYPVLNTTSARLLIDGPYRVLQVDDDRIANSERGRAVGIPGAPDELPAPDRLVRTGWLSCLEPEGGVVTALTRGEIQDSMQAVLTQDASSDEGSVPRALLVQVAGDLHLVVGGRRHLVPRAQSAAVLRAVGQDTVVPWTADAAWLQLFPPGDDLDPVTIPGAGDDVPADVPAPPDTVVGSVVVVTDTERTYVVDEAGQLAPLSTFAEPLYRLGSGESVGPDLEVTAAQVRGMATAPRPVGGRDWPTTAPRSLPDGEVACAYLETAPDDAAAEPVVTLVPHPEIEVAPGSRTVLVQPAAGALVRSVASAGVSGPVVLIDQAGTAFAVPGADAGVLERLGYASQDVTTVPAPWVSLFAPGPELTVEAAAGPPGATGDAAPEAGAGG